MRGRRLNASSVPGCLVVMTVDRTARKCPVQSFTNFACTSVASAITTSRRRESRCMAVFSDAWAGCVDAARSQVRSSLDIICCSCGTRERNRPRTGYIFFPKGLGCGRASLGAPSMLQRVFMGESQRRVVSLWRCNNEGVFYFLLARRSNVSSFESLLGLLLTTFQLATACVDLQRLITTVVFVQLQINHIDNFGRSLIGDSTLSRKLTVNRRRSYHRSRRCLPLTGGYCCNQISQLSLVRNIEVLRDDKHHVFLFLRFQLDFVAKRGDRRFWEFEGSGCSC